jgi:Zn-finger protein
MEPLENSYKFYRNLDCAYFPCHKNMDSERFNCLFCYCPLYFLGENCGGDFKKAGACGMIKDCTDCHIPHIPENYERILNVIRKNIDQM